MHTEQMCVSEAYEALRELHVFCKNVRLLFDERLVRLLDEFECIEWNGTLYYFQKLDQS